MAAMPEKVEQGHFTEKAQTQFFLAFAVGLVESRPETQILVDWRAKGIACLSEYSVELVSKVDISFRALLSNLYQDEKHYSLADISAVAFKVSNKDSKISESITIAFFAMSMVDLREDNKSVLETLSYAIRGFRRFREQQLKIENNFFNRLFHVAKTLEQDPKKIEEAAILAKSKPVSNAVAIKSEKLYQELIKYNALLKGESSTAPNIDDLFLLGTSSLVFPPKKAHAIRTAYFSEVLRSQESALYIETDLIRKGTQASSALIGKIDESVLFYFALAYKLSEGKSPKESLDFACSVKQDLAHKRGIGLKIDLLDERIQILYRAFLNILRFSPIKLGVRSQKTFSDFLNIHGIYRDLPLIQRARKGELVGFIASNAARLLSDLEMLEAKERESLLTAFQLISKTAYDKSDFCEPTIIEAIQSQSKKKLCQIAFKRNLMAMGASADPDKALKDFVSGLIKTREALIDRSERDIKSSWEAQKVKAIQQSNAQFSAQLSEAERDIRNWAERTKKEAHSKAGSKLIQTAGIAVATYLIAPQFASIVTQQITGTALASALGAATTTAVVNAGAYAAVSTTLNTIANDDYGRFFKHLFKELALSVVSEGVAVTGSSKLMKFSKVPTKLQPGLHHVAKSTIKASTRAALIGEGFGKAFTHTLAISAATEIVMGQMSFEDGSDLGALSRLGVESMGAALLEGEGNVLNAAGAIFTLSCINGFVAEKLAGGLEKAFPSIFEKEASSLLKPKEKQVRAQKDAKTNALDNPIGPYKKLDNIESRAESISREQLKPENIPDPTETETAVSIVSASLQSRLKRVEDFSWRTKMSGVLLSSLDSSEPSLISEPLPTRLDEATLPLYQDAESILLSGGPIIGLEPKAGDDKSMRIWSVMQPSKPTFWGKLASSAFSLLTLSGTADAFEFIPANIINSRNSSMPILESSTYLSNSLGLQANKTAIKHAKLVEYLEREIEGFNSGKMDLDRYYIHDKQMRSSSQKEKERCRQLRDTEAELLQAVQGPSTHRSERYFSMSHGDFDVNSPQFKLKVIQKQLLKSETRIRGYAKTDLSLRLHRAKVRQDDYRRSIRSESSGWLDFGQTWRNVYDVGGRAWIHTEGFLEQEQDISTALNVGLLLGGGAAFCMKDVLVGGAIWGGLSYEPIEDSIKWALGKGISGTGGEKNTVEGLSSGGTTIIKGGLSGIGATKSDRIISRAKKDVQRARELLGTVKKKLRKPKQVDSRSMPSIPEPSKPSTSSSSSTGTGSHQTFEPLQQYKIATERQRKSVIKAELDFMPQGFLDGQLYPKEKLIQLVEYLRKRDVNVLPTSMLPVGKRQPGFQARNPVTGKPTIYLLENPTVLEVKHELSHFLDCRDLGVAQYSSLTRFEKEKMVLERLKENRLWDQLNKQEKDFSKKYVDGLKDTLKMQNKKGGPDVE